MIFFENAPDYIKDIFWCILYFLFPFYSISLLFYYYAFGTFKKKPFVVKVLLIIIGFAMILPTILFAFDDITWAFISLITTPIISFTRYAGLFSVLIPIPLIITAKTDKKKIAPIFWILYAAFVGASTIIMIVTKVFLR